VSKNNSVVENNCVVENNSVVENNFVAKPFHFSYRKKQDKSGESGESEYSQIITNDPGQVSYLTMREKARRKDKRTEKSKTRSAGCQTTDCMSANPKCYALHIYHT